MCNAEPPFYARSPPRRLTPTVLSRMIGDAVEKIRRDRRGGAMIKRSWSRERSRAEIDRISREIRKRDSPRPLGEVPCPSAPRATGVTLSDESRYAGGERRLSRIVLCKDDLTLLRALPIRLSLLLLLHRSPPPRRALFPSLPFPLSRNVVERASLFRPRCRYHGIGSLRAFRLAPRE